MHFADVVVVAAGAWSSQLVPNLEPILHPTGMYVFHFRPKTEDIDRQLRPPFFLPFAANIEQEGWYGFCSRDDTTGGSVFKVGNHGSGVLMSADDPKVVPVEEQRRWRDFFARSLPIMEDATLIRSRLCMYCDTFDGHFLIDHVPGNEGLFCITFPSFLPVTASPTLVCRRGGRHRWLRPRVQVCPDPGGADCRRRREEEQPLGVPLRLAPPCYRGEEQGACPRQVRHVGQRVKTVRRSSSASFLSSLLFILWSAHQCHVGSSTCHLLRYAPFAFW